VIVTWLFDLALLGVLIAYAVHGWRTGFVRAIAGFAGVVVGAIIAFFVAPVIGGWVPGSTWRIVAVVATSVFLVLGGHALGATLGVRFRGSVKQRAVRLADRVLGAAVSFVAASLVVGLLASSAVGLGLPSLSRTIASSTVLRVIALVTPDPVETLVGRIRSLLVQDGLPAITEALGGIVNPPTLPNVDTGSPALTEAAQSVVRITGTASECGQNQAGSGFVVAADRVITNAHVLAGVTEPIIETPGGQALSGTIVYFDPIDDLAVIAVPGLSAPPLTLTDTAADGDKGVVNGYPFGGPFVTTPAEVLSVDTAKVFDIYRSSQNNREVYTLATTVEVGDSGGPLLTLDGEVTGVVFAKAANTANVGYAMTMAELDPVAARAPALTAEVGSGTCSRG
jgi:S1-C subfamily serine protease